MAAALASAGHHHQATTLAGQAEAIIGSLTGISSRELEQALTALTCALARTGQHQQAEATARSITDWPHLREAALQQVARALAKAGQHQHAETVARAIADPHRRAYALAEVAKALARAGESLPASPASRRNLRHWDLDHRGSTRTATRPNRAHGSDTHPG